MLTRRIVIAILSLGCWSLPARGGDVIEEERTGLGGIAVPAARARVLARPRLGGTDACVLGFGADLPEGERDLFAVVVAGRVVALEVLSWRGLDGAHLSTHLSAVSDGVRLRLERTASARRGRLYRREAWIDYLAWRDAAPMADAPVRPVLAGTWQAGLAAQRADMRAILFVGPRDVAPALIAACPAPAFGV
jgi:hypothetical protein